MVPLLISTDNSKIKPSIIEVQLGEMVTIMCESFGLPYWMQYDHITELKKPSSRNSLVQGNKLHIFGILKENEGHYECMGNTEELNIWSKYNVAFVARSTLTIASS